MADDALFDWRSRDVIWALLVGSVLGGALFWLIVPLEVLNPTHFSWLMWGDPMQQFLGWHFFRSAQWMWPLGASPYGMEMGSSVVFTDSIPLFALLFKTVAAALPQKFQYFGLWILICFILQGAFAWLLACCVASRALPRLLIALLLTASVLMVQRVIGHFALVGHWLILAALLLYVRPPDRAAVAWCVLASITSLVHAYILYLVLAVWAASLLHRYATMQAIAHWRHTLGKALTEMVIVSGGMLAVMWVAGYFTVPTSSFSGGTQYYGLYAANLNAFWNPGWGSRFLPAWPATGESLFEGYGYLGAGGLLLMLLAAVILLFSGAARRGLRSHWALILVCVVLWAIAVSNRVVFDDRVVLTLAFPEWLLKFVAMVRASGRLLWVPYYALLLGAAAVLLRYTKAWIGVPLLLGVVVLQGLDLSPRALGLRAHFQEYYVVKAKEWRNPLSSPFWEEAAQRYRTVRFVPARPSALGYGEFGLYAADHGMAINTGQFARLSNHRIGEANYALNKAVAEGALDSSNLYIFWKSTEEGPFPVKVGKQDRVEIIDGVQVVAPDWYGRSGGDALRWTRENKLLLP